jgi:DAK2 domain fusion protein YloV
VSDPSIVRFRVILEASLAALEARREEVNDLNVFPVADGDTGDNMVLTLRAVLQELDRLAGASQDRTIDDIGRTEIVSSVARAALLGARGNSGVILSQLIRGAAEELASRPGELVDPVLISAALARAADQAYGSVRDPAEGTILTVVREMSARVASDLAHMTNARLGADATDAQQNEVLAELIENALAAGEESVKRGPDLLPVLREAGVVDAGGAGLVEIVRGIAAGVSGEPIVAAPVTGEALGVDAIHQELSRYRYCTVFVVEGDDLDVADLESELEQIGDSLLVVGDRTALKIHVHTDDPGRALSLGVARGVVEGVEIANMHAQAQEREARLLHAVTDVEPARCAVVAVTAGEGNRALFESGGARVVEGGRTMNPSTADLVAAIETAAAPEVVVLPNNSNVIMSAEQAAGQSAKAVRVVPTRSLQAGLSALVAFDPTQPAEANAAAMAAALEGVATGAVTVASRDVLLNGVSVQKGKWLGLADGLPVAGGETFDEVAGAVLERLLEEPRGLVTLLTGEKSPPLAGLLAELESRHPELELDVHEGGQPHYPLLLAAE